MSAMMFPIASSHVTLLCANAPILVYVLASNEYYGVLIPLDDLPEIPPDPNYNDPLDKLFDEMTQYFGIRSEERRVGKECRL